MKTRIIIPLLALLAGSVVAADKPSTRGPLEGTWELVSMDWTGKGKDTVSVSGTSCRQLKMYAKGHFTFVGRFTEGDKPASDRYGGGTYTLTANDYVETLQFHMNTTLVGKTLHFKLVVNGNTMTQTGPIPVEDQESFGGQLVEVYRRLD
jgi:hypothetical protein